MTFSLKSQIKIILSVLFAILIALLPLFAANVYAQGQVGGGLSPGGAVGGGLTPGGQVGGGLSPGGQVGGPNSLQNPLGVDSVCELISVLLRAAMIIGVPIAVLFIVFAGLKFVLARGNPGELTEARHNFIATIIGIAIFLGAALIGNVIIATLAQLGASGVTSCTF